MQSDDFRDVPFFEVTLHGIPYGGPDRLERIALGEDRLADRLGGEAALGRFFYNKNDLDYGLVSVNRPVTQRMW